MKSSPPARGPERCQWLCPTFVTDQHQPSLSLSSSSSSPLLLPVSPLGTPRANRAVRHHALSLFLLLLLGCSGRGEGKRRGCYGTGKNHRFGFTVHLRQPCARAQKIHGGRGGFPLREEEGGQPFPDSGKISSDLLLLEIIRFGSGDVGRKMRFFILSCVDLYLFLPFYC